MWYPTTVALSMVVAFAAAAIESNPARPVLFGSQKTAPPRGPPSDSIVDNENYTEWRVFDQLQSHSNAHSVDMFPMRYVSNSKFYRPGGPIFLFVGGPWELEQHFVEQGHFVDLAEENNAFVVANEMRYYGESLPVPNASRGNLRLLHIVQACTDIARLIVHIRYEVLRDPNARVIVAGVGFSGSLAHWTRLRYPHLIHGVWASGAMLQANENYREFAEEVGEYIRRYGGNDCYGALWRGFRTAENLIDAGQSQTVDTLFKVCTPINGTNPLDVEAFFYGIFNEVVTNTLRPNLRQNIRNMCDTLTHEDHDSSLTGLASWITGQFPEAECLAMDLESIVQLFQETDWQHDVHKSGERQWFYQRCTELGWPLTADSMNQPFGVRISANLFQQLCQRVFDGWLTSDVFRSLVRQTNTLYGGNRPEMRFVFYTHGSLDPWRFTGVTTVLYNNNYVNVIRGAIHGEDLASISDLDWADLRRSKEEVGETIRRWLERRV
ncbi:thymus-specific serine protease [Aedes aegypti]|uniref:Uncharacterized protein n=2 Tax=Aedes aegypti TaxID=7159 RepID=A0A1S4FWV4_AEDAE|nr:thymus-specific serine protease [Aedes aegypti]